MTAPLVLRLAALYGWTCHYCPAVLSPSTATRDHIVPRSTGGVTIFRNVTLACGRCNSRLGAALVKCHCERCQAAREHVARHHQAAALLLAS